MYRARRHLPGALLLCALALTGCSSPRHVAGPYPGQDVDGIVLRSQQTIVFPDSADVVVKKGLVVVHEGTGKHAYLGRHIDHVIVTESSFGYTVGNIVLGSFTTLLLSWICDDPVEWRSDGEGGWTQECVDEEEEEDDDESEPDRTARRRPLAAADDRAKP